MSSIKPDSGRDEINSGQEVAGGFVVAGGNGPEWLEFAEKVLDQVPRFVKFHVVEARLFSVPFRRNNDHFPCGLQGFNHPFIGIVAFVSQHGLRRKPWQQHIGAIQITGLPWRQNKPGGVSQGIDRGIDFGT